MLYGNIKIEICSSWRMLKSKMPLEHVARSGCRFLFSKRDWEIVRWGSEFFLLGGSPTWKSFRYFVCARCLLARLSAISHGWVAIVLFLSAPPSLPFRLVWMDRSASPKPPIQLQLALCVAKESRKIQGKKRDLEANICHRPGRDLFGTCTENQKERVRTVFWNSFRENL